MKLKILRLVFQVLSQSYFLCLRSDDLLLSLALLLVVLLTYSDFSVSSHVYCFHKYIFFQVHVLSDNSIGPVVQVTPPTDNDNRSVDKHSFYSHLFCLDNIVSVL